MTSAKQQLQGCYGLGGQLCDPTGQLLGIDGHRFVVFR